MPASKIAKVKTLTQQFAVGFAIAAADRRSTPSGCGTGLLWVSVVLALISGAQYLWTRAEPSHDRDAVTLSMRCDVVAVGTELLLGQIIDTN